MIGFVASICTRLNEPEAPSFEFDRIPILRFLGVVRNDSYRTGDDSVDTNTTKQQIIEKYLHPTILQKECQPSNRHNPKERAFHTLPLINTKCPLLPAGGYNFPRPNRRGRPRRSFGVSPRGPFWSWSCSRLMFRMRHEIPWIILTSI